MLYCIMRKDGRGMGLAKHFYTKRLNGERIAAHELRFFGESPIKQSKVPKKVAKKTQTNEDFVTDMLKDLL